jgi:hypothetical protein
VNRKLRTILLTTFGAFFAVVALMGAGQLLANTLATNNSPEIVNYQGYLTDSGGNPISSTVTLQFSIWDASSDGNQLWDETHNNVQVRRGYFSVLLGSQGTPLRANYFKGSPRYVEVVYGATTFPRQVIASVPYALVSQYATEALNSTYAHTATYALNGPSGGGGSVDWSHVVVVAKSGSDYTTINDALANISPSSTDRYLILVMPGTYTEQIVLPSYVHLKGAGVESTFVTFAANNANFNDASAVVINVPANSQVSDLTVRNDAVSNGSVALRITTGNEKTLINNVSVQTVGTGGGTHIALYLTGGNPKLTHVYAEVSGGTSNNWGIFNSASSPTIDDSSILATGNSPAGLRMNGGNPLIKESTISGTNGTSGQGINTSGGGTHTVKIDRSSVVGDSGGTGSSIISTDTYVFLVGASMLQGDVDVVAPAVIDCAQSYDGNYIDLNATCQ